MSEASTMIAQLDQKPDWISYEDFLEAYDGVRAEWVDGKVVEMTPQTDRHLLISGFLYKALSGFVELKGLGGLVAQAGFQVKLGPRVGREPDVFYLTSEHTHRFKRTFVDGPVDLAIELISPDSRVRDRREKFQEYQQAGVAEYWIIDPDAETVEVFRLASGAYEPVALGDPPRVTSEVIPGLWIDPSWMWAAKPNEWAAYREWGLI
jgi:Uma2 family endonuclease